MNRNFRRALAAGAERLAAWVDPLDRINVFPVPDGDTGRNLAASLMPLRSTEMPTEETTERLLFAARGNSGNLCAQFFAAFLAWDGSSPLARAAELGRDRAARSIAHPRDGTILTFFDGLAESLSRHAPDSGEGWEDRVLDRLEEVTRETTSRLPELSRAGVVDAGALGMFVFFDAFLNVLEGRTGRLRPIARRFADRIRIDDGWKQDPDERFCIDAVVRLDHGDNGALAEIAALGESVITGRHGDRIKLHFHTRNPGETRTRLGDLAGVLRWSCDDMGAQMREFTRVTGRGALHVVTDAAGTVTRADARELGMTVLDSYVTIGNDCAPESQVPPDEVYRSLRDGVPVTTSQASTFERHQHYARLLDQFERVLYLSVGSVYTGNFQTAIDWKRDNDTDGRFTVIDTGAASGRLGLVAMETARVAIRSDDPNEGIRFATKAIADCQEYIFLDRLKYLAAGGRMSKGGARIGDALHLKPVVSPMAEGARKVAVVRDREAQVRFALRRLDTAIEPGFPSVLLLQFTDNREWVEAEAAGPIGDRYPSARVLVRPMSLTTGSHTGPGTWAVAILPRVRWPS